MKQWCYDTSGRVVHYDVVLGEQLEDVVLDAVDAVGI